MPASAGATSSASVDQELRSFLDVDWRRWLAEYPELATVFGRPGFNDRWTDDSPAGVEARRTHLSESTAQLRRIQRDRLSPTERLNYDLYDELLVTATTGLAFGFDPLPFRLGMPRNLWMPLNQMDGIQVGAPDLLFLQPHETLKDYQDILARLGRLPAAVDETIALLEQGLALGYSPPRAALRGVPGQVEGLVPENPLESSLLRPFAEFPSGLSEDAQRSLSDDARRSYEEQVAPSFRRLHRFLVDRYLPACRESVAATSLPDGEAVYRFLVRWQTTVDLTPRQIHELGLSEVRRIREAMASVMARTGFKGTYREFLEYLRTDPRFFYEKADELVDGYRVIAKKVDPTLGRLFGRLPRLPYGVLPVPEFKAPSSPTAYYMVGAPATGRPGYFYANTHDLRARPRWEMEPLALHESVPGHHLQLALASEVEGLPEFRRFTGNTAYIEGWGLYAESLGEELGFYTDPYSRFGALTYDMWRSIRLVVDTGMHALGWTRDQAIDFFRENAGKSDLDIAVEVDRYIVWPGQALAYKIGQLKLRELRTRAEQALGERFDVRAFHDLVLAEGALPLSLLEERVDRWVDTVRRGAT